MNAMVKIQSWERYNFAIGFEHSQVTISLCTWSTVTQKISPGCSFVLKGDQYLLWFSKVFYWSKFSEISEIVFHVSHFVQKSLAHWLVHVTVCFSLDMHNQYSRYVLTEQTKHKMVGIVNAVWFQVQTCSLRIHLCSVMQYMATWKARDHLAAKKHLK